MPNFTAPIPPKMTGNAGKDIEKIKRWGTELTDELTYLFNHLDSGNVIEAASVKAENIDATKVKIENAKIGMLTADKLKTGVVDTELVKVKDKNGNLSISGSSIVISDGDKERFVAEYDKRKGRFIFMLCNENGEPTVGISDSGDAVFSGVLESSDIYACNIIGTDYDSYTDQNGGVFANIDKTGIKIMQDKNGRSQKLGMSVSDDGAAYIILGAGDGSGKKVINGVTYANGSFKVEKNDTNTSLGIVGGKAFVNFWDESGELWLSGSRVLVNGADVNQKISDLERSIEALSGRINSMNN